MIVQDVIKTLEHNVDLLIEESGIPFNRAFIIKDDLNTPCGLRYEYCEVREIRIEYYKNNSFYIVLKLK